MATNNKINFKNINLVFIPSSSLIPTIRRNIGMKYAARPKKTNARLVAVAKK